ncbi:hypothetical protein Csa_014902, partial [Cucumis sativus]
IPRAGAIFRASRHSSFSIRAAKLSLPAPEPVSSSLQTASFVQPFSVAPSFGAGSSLRPRRAPCTSPVFLFCLANPPNHQTALFFQHFEQF